MSLYSNFNKCKRKYIFRIICKIFSMYIHVTLSLSRQHLSMANYAVTIAIIVGIVCGQALSVVEDADRSLLGLNLSYGRGLVSICSSRNEI